MKNNLISIIVPVYNGEKYIHKCVDSILAQTYSNFELILVDDGSTDSCPSICDQYSKKDDRVIAIHQKNAGVSSARNKALDICKGDYICFIDQDDCITKDYLEYFLNLIIDNQCDISITLRAHRFIDDNIEIDNEFTDYVNVISGEDAAEQMLYYNIIIGPWNKMISKKIIDDYHIRYNPEFFGGEGFSFSVDCFQRATKVAVGHRKVYLYRCDNPESGTTKFSLKMINSNTNSQKFIYEHLFIKSEKLIRACKYSNWHSNCDSLNTIVGCKVIKSNRKIYNDIKKICRKDATCTFFAPVSLKEKFKGVLYLISPYLAARIINKLRLRKFTVEK